MGGRSAGGSAGSPTLLFVLPEWYTELAEVLAEGLLQPQESPESLSELRTNPVLLGTFSSKRTRLLISCSLKIPSSVSLWMPQNSSASRFPL